jgi:hypothetical protein
MSNNLDGYACPTFRQDFIVSFDNSAQKIGGDTEGIGFKMGVAAAPIFTAP